MEARTGGTGAAPATADEARQWVEAWAGHVRKRFNSRAVVSARIAGAAPVALSQVYALEGGGIVLVTPCDHAEDEATHDHAAHDHAADDHDVHDDGAHDDGAHDHDAAEEHHHEADEGAGAHGHGADDHGAAKEHHHEAAVGERAGAHDHAAHPHGEVGGCCGDGEVWVASPAQVVFEARCAAEGVWCTGFGVLGLSRTPHVLVPRGREAPPPRGHDHGEF